MPTDPTTPDGAAPSTPAPRAALGRWRIAPDGTLRDTAATDVERIAAATAHLWPLAIAVLGPFAPILPIAILLAFPRGSGFVADHAREAVNAQCTLLVLLLVPCVGWIALLAWLPVALVALVRGAIAASTHTYHRYPAILRPLRG
ncbi:MAG: hypothetical protein RI967_1046 [Planctomycetota bacterium]|jgi:uncharacterized Tic20 family protein